MRDIYVCVIFLRVKIYWMFFYWSDFFDVHFSYCEVFMCQVLGGLVLLCPAWGVHVRRSNLSFKPLNITVDSVQCYFMMKLLSQYAIHIIWGSIYT